MVSGNDGTKKGKSYIPQNLNDNMPFNLIVIMEIAQELKTVNIFNKNERLTIIL